MNKLSIFEMILGFGAVGGLAGVIGGNVIGFVVGVYDFNKKNSEENFELHQDNCRLYEDNCKLKKKLKDFMNRLEDSDEEGE